MRSSVVAPLAVMSGAAGWFITDLRTTDWQKWRHFEVSWMVVLGALAGLLAGVVLEQGFARRSLARAMATLLVQCALFGSALGLALCLQRWDTILAMRHLHVRVLEGLVGGLLAAPAAGALVVVARRPVASRSGSVVWDIERRAVWAVVAGAVALGGATAFFRAKQPAYAAMFGETTPFSLSFGALGILGTLWAFFGVVAAQRTLEELGHTHLEPCEGVRIARDAETIDMGIGDDVLGTTMLRGDYRSASDVVRVVRGSLDAARAAATRARRITGVAAAAATIAGVAQIVVYLRFI